MRYALQWVIFVCFCVVNAWLWFGRDRDPTLDDTPITVLDAATPPAAANAAVPPPPEFEPAAPAAVNITSDLDTLTELLVAGRFQEAVDLYSALYDKADDAQITRQRDRVLSHVNTLLDGGQIDTAIDLLTRYTNAFYQDTGALGLLARALHENGDYLRAIRVLFGALDEAHLYTEVAGFQEQLDRAVAAHAARLAEQGAAGDVAGFYESLIGRDPLYPPFKLGLARVHIDAGDPDRALELLRPLRANPDYGEQVNRLMASAEEAAGIEGVTSIPLQPVGNNYSVSAVVNGRSNVTLLVDTGASMTTLRPEVLQRVGVGAGQWERLESFTTANGVIEAPVVRLQSLTLGEQTVDDIEVGSIALTGLQGVDGLLGMNYLKNFEFTIRQQDNVIQLSR